MYLYFKFFTMELACKNMSTLTGLKSTLTVNIIIIICALDGLLLVEIGPQKRNMMLSNVLRLSSACQEFKYKDITILLCVIYDFSML